jgi:ferrous iron transport protein B
MATAYHPRRHEVVDVGSAGRPVVVCLAGNPNVGKSSLFNALTGESRETAHCAGVTVEVCSVCTRWHDRRIEVVDLPGSYALDGLVPTS